MVTTAVLPDGAPGVAYAATLAATGGTPPYTWSAGAGLPPGITVGATGTISGTPSAVGAYGFTVTVTDSLAWTATRDLSITVDWLTQFGLWSSATVPSFVGIAATWRLASRWPRTRASATTSCSTPSTARVGAMSARVGDVVGEAG